MPSLDCHLCGARLDVHEPVARDAECPSCGGDQRCCHNCRHYDPNFHNSCRETEADMVEDKARRNFCEFFSFSRTPFLPVANPRAADARAKLEGLFGGGPSAPRDSAADARRKLDGLFRKPADEDDT